VDVELSGTASGIIPLIIVPLSEGPEEVSIFENRYENYAWVTANTYHTELAGDQVGGSGAGSSADEILSDVHPSLDFGYKHYTTRKFNFGFLFGVRFIEYNVDLSKKILKDWDQFAVRAGFTLGYHFNKWLYMDFLAFYDEQLFYFGIPSTGEILFDVEGKFKFQIRPRCKAL